MSILGWVVNAHICLISNHADTISNASSSPSLLIIPPYITIMWKKAHLCVCNFSICIVYFSELSIKEVGDWHWPYICVCDSVVGFLFPHPCHGRESAKLLACTSHPPIAYKWLMHFGRRHFRSPNPGKVALFPLFFVKRRLLPALRILADPQSLPFWMTTFADVKCSDYYSSGHS